MSTRPADMITLSVRMIGWPGAMIMKPPSMSANGLFMITDSSAAVVRMYKRTNNAHQRAKKGGRRAKPAR